MKIIKRFAESISSPSSLIQSVNDKTITTILYSLVLVILMIIPYVINSFTYFDLDYQSKLNIRESFYKDDIKFKIENGTLVNYGSDEYYFNNNIGNRYYIYISDDMEIKNIKTSGINYQSFIMETIAVLKDGVYLYNGITLNKMFSYSDYQVLENLDLNDAGKDKMDFWEPVFMVLQQQINKIKPFYIAMYILSSIIQACMTVLLCSLVLTGFNRIGTPINLRFKNHWKLCVYGSTGFVLGNIFATLYNFMLLYYVGLFLSIAICAIASKKFIIRGGKNEL